MQSLITHTRLPHNFIGKHSPAELHKCRSKVAVEPHEYMPPCMALRVDGQILHVLAGQVIGLHCQRDFFTCAKGRKVFTMEDVTWC